MVFFWPIMSGNMCVCVSVCLAGSGDQVSGGRLKLWSPWLGWPGVDVNAEASVVGGSDSLGLTECVCVRSSDLLPKRRSSITFSVIITKLLITECRKVFLFQFYFTIFSRMIFKRTDRWTDGYDDLDDE